MSEQAGPHGTGDGAGANASHEGISAAAEQPVPPLVVNAQYVRDLSFEAPTVPQIFGEMQQKQPDISVKVDVQARQLGSNIYEVMLQLNATCKAGEATAFMVELQYGGVFTVNIRPEDVQPVLLIECPRILFPFARQIIASATVNGGFMPLMLGPIDFVGLYQRNLADQAAPGSAAGPVGFA
jgi:preprotein translocase subunit SecB